MINHLPENRMEYLLSSLVEKSMEADPLAQFSRWFKEAAEAEVEQPDAMILSTSGPSGNVSARVVLLKGIDKGGFVFFTNYDSRKGMQLASNPNAALTFPWLTLQRQVRVEGKVTRVTRRESSEYFNSRPIDSRISASISPQSCVIPDRRFLESMRAGLLLDLDGRPPECPSNWGGYRLKPVLVEFWQGRAHRLHDRIQYRQSKNQWIRERLAP